MEMASAAGWPAEHETPVISLRHGSSTAALPVLPHHPTVDRAGGIAHQAVPAPDVIDAATHSDADLLSQMAVSLRRRDGLSRPQSPTASRPGQRGAVICMSMKPIRATPRA